MKMKEVTVRRTMQAKTRPELGVLNTRQNAKIGGTLCETKSFNVKLVIRDKDTETGGDV